MIIKTCDDCPNKVPYNNQWACRVSNYSIISSDVIPKWCMLFEPESITLNSTSGISNQKFEYRLANIDFSGHTRKPYSDNEKTS